MPNNRGEATDLAAAIGVTAVAIELDSEMVTKGPDCIRMIDIRIAVSDAHDNRSAAAAIRRWSGQHGRDERIALAVAQREEQRHFPLDMGVHADLLLNEDSRRGPIGLRRLLLLGAEIFFDRVRH